MPRILVLGGTGFVGRHVCEKLSRMGWHITVPTRRPAQARALQLLPHLQLVQADVHDAQALSSLLHGHDAVVNLVAVLHGDAARFERVHVHLPRTLAQACRTSGVTRLVHVSALGADAQAISLYQRSKAQGEAVLQAGGLALTLLRPSVIYGVDDHLLNLFARVQGVLPVMPLPSAASQFQPVWVEDVAAAIVRCLQNPATIGQTYELAGPDVLSLGDLARLAGRCAGIAGGRGRPVVCLPTPLAYFQAWLGEVISDNPPLSRDNLDAMLVPNVASGHLPGLQALGITPASVYGIAPTYLGPQSPAGRLDLYRRVAQR